MRIIEIIGEPIYHGGQEAFIMNVLGSMDRSGFTVDALTPYECDNRRFRDLIAECGGEVKELRFSFHPGKSRMNIYKPLRRILREENYDVAHIHSGSISVLAYAAAAARNAGIRKVIVHSHSTGNDDLKHRIVQFLLSPAIKKYPTDYLACSRIAGEFKYPKSVVQEKLVVARNGIDVSKFRYDPARRITVRQKLSISENAFVMGHVGRISEVKNHWFLLELFAGIRKVDRKAILLLVGDGELREETERRIEELGLTEYVRMTGNVDNVQDYYQAMDVFVFPSLFEGLGITLIEAQTNGLQCFTSAGRVPGEVGVTGNVHFLSLDDGVEVWSAAVLNAKRERDDDAWEKVQEAGYDISETAAMIRKIYLDS